MFLISAQNIDCVYTLEPPRQGGSNEYHNLCFEQKYEKYQNFYLKTLVFGGESFNILNQKRNFRETSMGLFPHMCILTVFIRICYCTII